MALVMLPCDLPWWPTLQKHLTQISTAQTPQEFVEIMLKIHNMCNVGLDPDEERPDPATFDQLEWFLSCELTPEECTHFLTYTAPAMVRHALQLKALKPVDGMYFSLQQQACSVEYDRSFIASLLAHGFFSTFPRRTLKTHPTLQDCNFSNFFKHLEINNFQRAKLRSILHYFDSLEKNGEPTGKVTFSRQVMTSKDWLTIEDWLECELPLCPLAIRHEGRIERAEVNAVHVCFASSRLGGLALDAGASQESVQFCTKPELLAVLPSVEALEDNEVLTVDGLQQVARINDPRRKASIEVIQEPQTIGVCCMDAENYIKLPLSQFEEDNILRELNKALLGFGQNRKFRVPPKPPTRRLTPIGESFHSTPELEKGEVTTPGTCFHEKDNDAKEGCDDDRPPETPQKGLLCPPNMTSNRAKFIVLGSSGECLPVTRQPVVGLNQSEDVARQKLLAVNQPEATPRQTLQESSQSEENTRQLVTGSSYYSSCQSDPNAQKPVSRTSFYSSCQSEDSSELEFLSATGSPAHSEESDNEGHARKYSAQLDTPERRSTFAERLRDALRRETLSTCTSSTESSYAVGITVAGSDLADPNIRLKRGGSRGFVLQEDSLDDQFLRDSLQQEREWIEKFRSKRPGCLSRRGDTAESSKYSFSTEYSSELEELYDQFSRWLDDAALSDSNTTREVRARDIAVVKFAGSVLKRALSESFAGVSLSEMPAPPGDCETSRSKVVLAARSLSLELARHKDKIAAHLVSLLSGADGARPVATGNWGCGSTHVGDPQLKLIVQWLAGSLAGTPVLYYYTCGHHKLLKLDTVCRVLLDRQWTVGELVNAVLKYAHGLLVDPTPSPNSDCLFDALLGSDARP